MALTLLVDGDILIYRAGFSSEDKSEGIAKSRVNQTLESLLNKTGCKDYEIYVSDSSSNNFRYKIFPPYKANRTQAKPKHYQALSEHTVSTLEASVAWGQEADDAIGIKATELGEDCIIASIDKDLLQIPGTHYNWVQDIWRVVQPAEGLHRFYTQLLCGDSVDNITSRVGLSCPGVGPRKAFRYLEGCSDIPGYNKAIWQAFKDSTKKDKLTKEELLQRITVTGQLVKIRTQPDELWRYDYVEE